MGAHATGLLDSSQPRDIPRLSPIASVHAEGPTPNGGAYPIGVYVKFEGDATGSYREVFELKRTASSITEYDAEGKRLFETVARLGGQASP